MKKESQEKSWFRQTVIPLKETARQYEYFSYFLSLPPLERTSENVRKHFGLNSVRWIEEMRSKKNWNERAKDRDNFIAAKTDKDSLKKAKENAFDWIEWEHKNLEKSRLVADLFFARCFKMLEMPLTEKVETITKVTDDGKTIHQTTIHKPTKFLASDVPKYIEAAIILSNYVLEQSRMFRHNRVININLPNPSKPVEEMNDKERESYIEELKEAKRRLELGEYD